MHSRWVRTKANQSHWPGSNLQSSSHGTPQNNTQFFIFFVSKDGHTFLCNMHAHQNMTNSPWIFYNKVSTKRKSTAWTYSHVPTQEKKRGKDLGIHVQHTHRCSYLVISRLGHLLTNYTGGSFCQPLSSRYKHLTKHRSHNARRGSPVDILDKLLRTMLK